MSQKAADRLAILPARAKRTAREDRAAGDAPASSDFNRTACIWCSDGTTRLPATSVAAKPHRQCTEDPWLVEALPVGLSCESARAEERDQHEESPRGEQDGRSSGAFLRRRRPALLRRRS